MTTAGTGPVGAAGTAGGSSTGAAGLPVTGTPGMSSTSAMGLPAGTAGLPGSGGAGTSVAGASRAAAGVEVGDSRMAPVGPDLRLLPPAILAWLGAWWATAATTGQAAGLATLLGVVAAAAVVARQWPSGGMWRARLRRSDVASLAATTVVASQRHSSGMWRARLLGSGAVTLAATAVVLGATSLRLAERAEGPVPAWAAQRATATVVGQVVGDPRRLQQPGPDGRERWAVRLRGPSVAARGQVARAGGPILVLGGPAWGAAVAGSHVRVAGRFLPPRHGDPTIAALVTSRGPRVEKPGAWPWRLAERLREGLRTACRGLSPDAGGLLPALVVGDTSRLPATLTADLRQSGLTHLTAVSGANVSLLAGFVVLAAAYLGAGRTMRTVVTALAVLGFVVLARPEPSVLRAAVMGLVGLVGSVIARAGAGVPALSAATTALLIADPWLARSFGFVLSVVATAGLLLLVPVWLRRWHAPRPVAVAVAVPLAAQAVTAPVIVLLQPHISLVGVPANVLAAPAVAPATVAGVAAAALSPIWPWGAHVAALLGGAATWWIAGVAHAAADVPGGSLPWLPGRSGALLLALLTATVILMTAWPPRSWYPAARSWLGRWRPGRTAVPEAAPRHGAPRAGGGSGGSGGGSSGGGSSGSGGGHGGAGRGGGGGQGGSGGGQGGGRGGGGSRSGGASSTARPRLHLVLSLAVIVAVVAWLITDTRWPGSLTGLGSREDWAVVQCDVGQGDALVLRTGPRRAMLVDTGPEPDAVDACLSRWRVDRLDLVVITHFHADHAGGLAGALPGRGRPPVLVSPCARPGAQVAGATEATAEAGTEMRTGGPGLAGRLGDGGWPVHWEIVWPVLPGVTGAAGAARSAGAACGGVSSDHSEGSEINDASLVLVAVVRGIRVVVLGDVEISAQRLLAGRLRALGAVDVVKVAHHGSAKQHPPLYASLRARVALIGVGDNDYGHPAPSALTMLAATGARVLRTDRQGDLAVIARSRGLGIWTDHSGRRRRHRRRSDGRGGRGGRDVVE